MRISSRLFVSIAIAAAVLSSTAARTADAKPRHGLDLLVVKVPSPASGTTTIEATLTKRQGWMRSIGIFIDGAKVKECSPLPKTGPACTYAWDTTTAANGPHQVWAAITTTPGFESDTVIVDVQNAVVLTILTAGSGSGTTSGAGTYPAGTSATIAATPSGESIFAGWSGAGCPAGTATPPTVLMTSDTTCTATFTKGTFKADAGIYPVPSTARPALGVPTAEPTFGGNLITRITDPTMIPDDTYHAADSPEYVPRQGLAHEYSRYAGLNADGTKIVVQALGGDRRGGWALVDVASGDITMWLPIEGDPEVSWHLTDPNRAFFRAGNRIHVLRADTLTVELLMDFPQYGYVHTGQEGRPSDDWRYFAFRAFPRNADGSCCDFSQGDLVVADLVAKTVLATWTPAELPDWVGMSPSGHWVVGMFGDFTKVFTRDLTFVKNLFPGFSHGDFALDTAGNEVFVYLPQTFLQVAEFDFKTGFAAAQLDPACTEPCKRLVLETGYWWAGHASGIASRTRPGWVLISTYNEPTEPQQPFGREIFWLSLDGTQSVKRIAHHRSDVAFGGPLGKDYFAEPHATSSWDGNTVVFTSAWGDAFSRYDVYTLTGVWWP